MGAAPESFQLRDVPGPDLVRAVGDQLWADPGRVSGLGAALADLVRGARYAVPARNRRDVGALLQQDRRYLQRGLFGGPAAVEHREQLAGLVRRQRRRVRRPLAGILSFRRLGVPLPDAP